MAISSPRSSASDPDGQPLLPDGLPSVWLEGLLSGPDAVIYFKDRQSRFVMVSEATATKHGLSREQMIGLRDADFFADGFADFSFTEEQRIMSTGQATVYKEVHETWQDRPDTWAGVTKRPLRDQAGEIIGIVGISQDVTRRVVAEQVAAQALADLRAVEAQLRTLLENSPDAILRVGTDLRLSFVNPAAEHLLRRSREDVLGRSLPELGLDPELSGPLEEAWRSVLSTGDPTAVELATGSTDDAQWLHCRIGAERDATGQVVSLLMSARDITELKRAQHVVSQQALTDSVTGLANRNLLTDRVRQALVRLERRPGHIALLFVDLDRFKEINDTHGHHVGDEVLCEIAHRLQVLARRGDTVARLGGDEFVILCDGIADPGDARAIASRAVSAAAEPIRLLHGLVQVSASVGVVVTGDPRSDPAELLRSADAAMYRAKRSGRNAFRLWDRTLDDGGQAERGMESELLGALDRAELRLAFQPLLSLGDRSVQGFEALIRWQHPTRGLLAPGDFLPSAEASGVMDRIGAWVLDAAVAQLASWSALPRAGTSGPLTMAVNVSGAQLRAPGFSGLVAATLRRHDVAPQHLVIEVAEHALAQDALTGDVRDVLIELTALGVRLAVDDFGMRYTSLARLPTLPVSIVKLDRVTDDTRAQRIAAAVVAMAHGLGMSVVGEGIETAAQLRDLVDLSVDDGQGFLLGHPVDGATAGQLLSAHGG